MSDVTQVAGKYPLQHRPRKRPKVMLQSADCLLFSFFFLENLRCGGTDLRYRRSAPDTSALLKKFPHFGPPHLVWWSAGAEERRCGPRYGSAQLCFLLILTPFQSNSLMQELTSTFIPSSLSLVNSGTLFPNLYFHLPMTYTF